MDINELWNRTLALLSVSIDNSNYDLWMKYILPKDLKGNVVELLVPNSFTKDIFVKRFLPTIERYLRQVTGDENSRIEIFVSPFDYTQQEERLKHSETPIISFGAKPDPKSNLNPKYVFENFVIGESNKFAYAAARSVAQNPGVEYNPLFLCGGVGLGKTHLMQAIGNEVLKLDPSKKVVYVSSEKFTNELINSLAEKNNESFRKKYREVDLLLIDDIQFIAGKSGTQEEFFHTFNTLYQNNKHIIMTSDKMPKEIPAIEERLRSRFESGLTADIQSPDLETRIAILRKKKMLENLDIDEEVLTFIAKSIKSNVRELEGAMVRVIAHASLMDSEMSIETCSEILKAISSERPKKRVTAEMIQETVAKKYGITVEDLHSNKRNREIALPRQIAMYLTRELTEISFPKIGTSFGGKDHTTVIHAHTKIEKEMRHNPEFKKEVHRLSEEIQR